MTVKPVIAFFDLDHTLIDGANGNIYALRMVREGYMKPGVLLQVLRFTLLYKMNRLPRREVYTKVVDIMGQYTVLEMIAFMDRNFESHVLPRIYLGGVDAVREHRDKGHHTVIATAAGEYVAERIRVQLGADDVIASHTPIKGDHMTSEELGRMAFMEEKLAMAEEYCAKHGADLADCWFYSDSASDLPLLEAVGHPVMVNPQWKLRQLTRGRGWPIMRFKEYATFDEVKRPERLITPEMNRFMRVYEESLASTD
jgi:HAD superfamily hydrolase (TIGR01490 family)